MRIAVYCSAEPSIHAHYLPLAYRVGQAIAAAGADLVSGGGRVGMMGPLARGVRDGGTRTVGVITRFLRTVELCDEDADELVVVDDLDTRKREMAARADAFLILAGGVGTLDEFADALSTGYLGEHTKPVVIYDPHDDYALLLDWLVAQHQRRFITAHTLSRLQVTHNLAAAIATCTGVALPAGEDTTAWWKSRVVPDGVVISDREDR